MAKSAITGKRDRSGSGRTMSQAEIDFYAGQESGEHVPISQAHLDEIGQGKGGEGLTPKDVRNNYAPLTEKELKEYDWGYNKYGWKYIFRDGVKVDRDGVPYVDKQYDTLSDEGDEGNTMTLDDEGRFPDEPGYGKGPDWEPPFQTGGVDDPSDAEIDFLMDDANFGIGGDLLETNTETGANISTFELGLGYGNVGGWTPTPATKKEKPIARGSSVFASMNASAKPNTQRRQIREKRTLRENRTVITGNV